MKSTGRILGTFAAVAGLLAFGACHKAEVVADQNSSGEKRFHLSGQIVKIDKEHGELQVQHNAVEGLMPAMTMEF